METNQNVQKKKEPLVITLKKNDLKFYSKLAIIIVLIGLLVYNLSITKTNILSEETQTPTGLTGIISESKIIPKGEPLYGKDFDFSYDDLTPNDPLKANNAIKKFSLIDQQTTLSGKNLERYIDILYNQHGGISCEYCCGARAIIFENGEMACGCAHSFAMRGLAKHLIINYPQLTDDEILEEIGKLKVLFFPEIHEQKASIMESSGLPIDYISLTTNEYRGVEQGKATGGMVGGC